MRRSPRNGMIAVGGAVVSAVASSACCWLPLTLLALGVSAGGLSAWFEQYRVHFLSAAGISLAIGFYLVYARAPKCEPGTACATDNRRATRWSKVGLWLSTVVIVAFATFPKYVGALLPSSPSNREAVSEVETVTLSIEGLTCEACAVHLREELLTIPGVLGARVSSGDAQAVLDIDPDSNWDQIATLKTISRAGYAVRKP